MTKQVKAAEKVDAILSAADRVKNAFYSVKVSKKEANELERQLEGELFEKWNESFESMQCTKVPLTDLKPFLDRLENSYEGIDKKVRKKMELIMFSGSWQDKIMEWKFNKGETGARYGMMAFGKSADGKEIDCMYILYKMDFKVAPKVTVTTKHTSILFSLFEWSIPEEKTEPRFLGHQSRKRFQNYFRLKALEGFCSEGVIDRVSYVN
ncbi:uncharacterized protein LOC128169766 [Crassostrea angulata]|uniref:uncharacterized protein LOC128169766 n=1 Tax=Magallana angulata TaxID=2784310 RepID=UPI0022B19787|nr:uncharacterized protein LOC128169766 [Crassostrea angulata]